MEEFKIIIKKTDRKNFRRTIAEISNQIIVFLLKIYKEKFKVVEEVNIHDEFGNVETQISFAIVKENPPHP